MARKKGTKPLSLIILPILFLTSPEGGLVDPQLRASDEHIPIVRVPRAGGRPGYPFPATRSFLLPQVLKDISDTSICASNNRRNVYVFPD
ncbi:MAG: hypothetical protein ACREJN_13370 [Nitrospiraceae bacterium]